MEADDNQTHTASNELELLRQREQELIQQKTQHEADFGQQRAKFIEMYQQKEEELRKALESAAACQKRSVDLEERIKQMTVDIHDIKTVAAIAEVGNEDDIDRVERKYREEVASMQEILKETASQIQQEATSKYDSERMLWLKQQEKLEAELQELKRKISQEREGFLTSITKTLQKVGTKVATTGSTREEDDNLEQSMKKAQEDASILRSVIGPLEEEINSLKAELKQYKDCVNELSRKKNGPLDGASSPSALAPASSSTLAVTGSDAVDGSMEDKVKELHHNLQTEKSSRTDLEMYVAVLNTQKSVLQDDADKLRSQLHEVCKLLEQEKLEHTDLKRTWQMANDQFLESQRLMVMDMRRVESVLSAEQQRRITELKKDDSERDQMERRVRELEELREREQEEQRQRRESVDQKRSAEENAVNKTTPPRRTDSDVLASQSTNGSNMTSRSTTDRDVTEKQGNKSTASTTGGELGEERLSRRTSVNLQSGLTEAQQQSLLDPTPESEESQTILASAKAKLDVFSTVGKRLVSEKEWEALQKEVCSAREKVGKPCDMCTNYESQLQTVQEGEKKMQGQLHSLERHLQAEREALKSHERYTTELENNLKGVAEKAELQILTLLSKVTEAEKFIMTVKIHFNQSHTELHEQLKSLRQKREDLQEQMTRLQDENDILVGKHSKLAQEMQDESIDFPNTIEELQLLLLKYREEMITTKVSYEHQTDLIKSETMFLKSQLVAEQNERATMEESMIQEIGQLQEKLAISNSIACEVERLKMVCSEEESRRIKAELVEKECRDVIGRLEGRLHQLTEDKSKLEQELVQMKGKVMSLQIDLNNSEVVQRDFVKLSQSLQIQLEKIRASENEVRWQHEEDVNECVNCKQIFNVTHRKHHCKHCGQIFCIDCLTKTVNSGPSLRPSKVCDVCHTILVREATPYFSSESPRTPD